MVLKIEILNSLKIGTQMKIPIYSELPPNDINYKSDIIYNIDDGNFYGNDGVNWIILSSSVIPSPPPPTLPNNYSLIGFGQVDFYIDVFNNRSSNANLVLPDTVNPITGQNEDKILTLCINSSVNPLGLFTTSNTRTLPNSTNISNTSNGFSINNSSNSFLNVELYYEASTDTWYVHNLV